MRAAVIALIGVVCLVSAQVGRDAGFVVDITGAWNIAAPDGSVRPAKRSEVVRDGDVLRQADNDPLSYVVVALYSGVKQKCPPSNRISAPAATSPLARILQQIRQRFEEGFVSASVRGGRRFNDGIVRADVAGIDLSEVFSGTEGTYQVEAYPVRARTIAPTAVARGRIRAEGGPAGFLPLKAGLYQLAITGTTAGSAGVAWVYVIDPDRYAAARKTFDELARVEPGADDETRSAARSLARGYLTLLNDEPTAR